MTGPFERGRGFLEQGELADAMRSFLEAIEQDPAHVDGYFALMSTYELAYTVFPDPQLLQQVKNLLLGVRDQDLDDEQERLADEIEQKIDAQLEAADLAAAQDS